VSTIRRTRLVEALRRRGLHERADWVGRAMPEDIDVQRNSSLFDMLGIQPGTLSEEADEAPGDPD
jgi:hypothetical protein